MRDALFSNSGGAVGSRVGGGGSDGARSSLRAVLLLGGSVVTILFFFSLVLPHRPNFFKAASKQENRQWGIWTIQHQDQQYLLRHPIHFDEQSHAESSLPSRSFSIDEVETFITRYKPLSNIVESAISIAAEIERNLTDCSNEVIPKVDELRKIVSRQAEYLNTTPAPSRRAAQEACRDIKRFWKNPWGMHPSVSSAIREFLRARRKAKQSLPKDEVASLVRSLSPLSPEVNASQLVTQQQMLESTSSAPPPALTPSPAPTTLLPREVDPFGPQGVRYLEWGPGGSTYIGLEEADFVFTVENSPQHCTNIRRDRSFSCYFTLLPTTFKLQCGSKDRSTLGTGQPKFAWISFDDIITAPDTQENVEHYDVVLVDGRYRMACLFYVLPYIDSNSLVVFSEGASDRYKSDRAALHEAYEELRVLNTTIFLGRKENLTDELVAFYQSKWALYRDVFA